MIQQIAARLRSLFRGRQLEAEMAEEMRHHVDLQTELNRQAGLKPEEARYAALRQFGNVASIQEQARTERSWVWLETFGKDLRFAIRRLLRTPAFTITALITLALCLGANIAIFTVVDAVLLRPLPFPEPERLMTVVNSYPGAGYPHAGPSIPNYFAHREAIKAFSGVALWAPVGAFVGEPGSVRQVQVARVTPEFFATLGVPLAMGRMFTDAELTYQTAAVVVLADEFWRTQFDADPKIVGKALMADGLPSTIIGVLPPGFRFLSSQAQFFKPLAFNPPERELTNRHNSLPGMIMVARLWHDATIADAQAQLDALDARQAKIDPSGSFLKQWGYHSIVESLHADYIRQIRPTLLLLQGGVLVLLLIAGVNLANLLLVRISGRSHELAIRQALGARQSHLAREAWLETTLLALAGGLLGLALGAAGVRLLMTLGAGQLPLGTTIVFDRRVVAIALVAALVLGGLLAIAPIWFMRRVSISSRLQAETTGGLPGGAAQRLRQSFGMVQMALALVLLSGAGLLGVSLRRALAQPLGFAAERVLVGKIGLPWKGYRSAGHWLNFIRRLEPALSRLPGGVHVSVNNSLPFSGFTGGGPVAVAGRTEAASVTVRAHHHAGVTADYWRVMGIPLLRGRLPGVESYDPGAPRACVIDQAMADAYWPNADPIGQRVCFGTSFDPVRAMTVIGVVGNVKQANVTETQPMGMIYSPFAQFPTSWFFVVMRGELPAAVMAGSLRKAVKELDPELVVTDIATMERMVDDSLLTRRSPALLAAIFAGLALLLCVIGTYGVVVQAVSHRRREIGVRLALGAQPRQVVALFLAMGLRLLAGGCLLGLLGAWATGRAMRGVLFEVAAFPPSIIGGAAALLGLVVICAVGIPAARAAAVDPCETLRHE